MGRVRTSWADMLRSHRGSHPMLCNPSTPLPGCPWAQSSHSVLLDTSPEGGRSQPSPQKPRQSQGINGPGPCPSTGLRSLTPQGQQQGGPTLSVLIMHLLLVRVLESLAVPTVPATGTQGSEEVLRSLAPTRSTRAGCVRAVAAQEELELMLGSPPAAFLCVAGCPLEQGTSQTSQVLSRAWPC